MKISKIIHYANVIKQYGLKITCEQAYIRFKKKYFITIYKKKSLNRNASSNWEKIKNENNYYESFEKLLENMKRQKVLENIYNSTLFQKSLPTSLNYLPEVIQRAENISKNCFEILGSEECFTSHGIPWQEDLKIKNDNLTTGNYAISNKPNKGTLLEFYADIKIKIPYDNNFTNYSFDIKVPWEISRFNHIFVLGKAYKETLNSKYALTFKNQVEDWINKNPYLLGINWVCPMDVSIRCINWIWGFYFFYNSSEIDNDFWKRFISSIYDHTTYLEYNSEKAFKPHNHYLADLIGQLYIGIFLEDLVNINKKNEKCVTELLNELERQIKEDGTSYEGSSSYHRLVTEIFLHFYLIVREKNLCSNKLNWIENKLQKMYQFLADCTDNNGNFIQVGDNDSGKILCGIQTNYNILSNKSVTTSEYIDYPNFGISIIKNRNWHITMRHHVYDKNQPSGHFHNDQTSITVSINNIPVLIDPGTYLYTSNPKWRNYFREPNNHNKISIEGENNNYKELFELNLKTSDKNYVVEKYKSYIKIKSVNSEYIDNGFNVIRSLTFDNNHVEIRDEINRISNALSSNFISSLIFHPDIDIKEEVDNYYLVFVKNIVLAHIKTNLKYSIKQGYYSPSYGKIIPCNKLMTSFSFDKNSIIRIELLDKN